MPELKLNDPESGLIFEVDYALGLDAVSEDGIMFPDALTIYTAEQSLPDYGVMNEVEQMLSRNEVVQLYTFLGKYLAETVNSEQTES